MAVLSAFAPEAMCSFIRNMLPSGSSNMSSFVRNILAPWMVMCLPPPAAALSCAATACQSPSQLVLVLGTSTPTLSARDPSVKLLEWGRGAGRGVTHLVGKAEVASPRRTPALGTWRGRPAR